MGISGISGISGYGMAGIYPMYNNTPVGRVSGADPVERGTDGTAQATADGAKDAERSGKSGKVPKGECQTCKRRKYVDGSNEGDVSFKSPAHIDPSASAAVVMGHEKEHLSNAIAEGNEENKELVSASITLKTSVCPECGRVYVSGGVTNTTIRTTSGQKNENPYNKLQDDLNYKMAAGANFDLSA